MELELIRKKIREGVKEYFEEELSQREEFMPGKTKVNYAGRIFDEREIQNLVDASLDFWLTSGRFTKEFSRKIKEFHGIKHALLTNSGSSANLLAITALTSPKLGNKRLLPGDEVITVAAGFPMTLAPIIQNQLVPVFFDIELGSYNIDVELLEKAITKKTKAIFLAHTLGNPFNLDAIMKLVDKYDLWLIEDACDSFGSKYNGKLTGTFGHLATLSFYPAHHITTGEGGCVITNDEKLAKIVCSYRDWGRDCYCAGGENNTCGKRFTQQFGMLPYGYDHKYVYSHVGYNLKMTELQAAIGCAQMDKLPGFIKQRIDNFDYLFEALSPFTRFFILPTATPNSIPSWFCFIITLRQDVGFTRNELVKFLNNNKVETRNLFAGNLLKQPAFMDINHRIIGDLWTTDYVMNNTFFLGVYPGMTKEKIDYVVSVLERFLKEK